MHYGTFYHTTFVGNSGKKALTRDDWIVDKTKKATKLSRIEVVVSEVEVTLNGPDQAQVQFMQQYTTNKYCDRGKKIQQWTRSGTDWQITREEQPAYEACDNRCGTVKDEGPGPEWDDPWQEEGLGEWTGCGPDRKGACN